MKLLKLLRDKNNEFHKLERTDQLVCLDLLDKKPEAVRSWVDYLGTEYAKNGTKVDADKLFNELTEFAETVKRLEE